jgi:acetyl esterase/lipase
VAALGGGGNLPPRTELGELPFFVGVGSRDFARPQALALHQRLRAMEAKVTLHEYPEIEHLAIVQFALPEVFALFDTVAKR